MDVLTQRSTRTVNSKPTGLYLIELRSRFLGHLDRRRKLTPPVAVEPAGSPSLPPCLHSPLRRVKS